MSLTTFNYEPTGKVELPATEIVLLATKCFRDMTEEYAERYSELSDAGKEDEEEAVELTELMQDGSCVRSALDPRYTPNTTDYPGELHPLSFRRYLLSILDSGGILPNVPDEICTIEARFKKILELGTITKARCVVPDFVKKHRERRDADQKMAKEDKDREDVLLDFLLFLAEKRERAGLFRYVGSN